MKKCILLGAIASFSFFTWAGDNGGGSISCQSSDGSTKVTGGAGVQYNGVGPASFNFTIGTNTVVMNPAVMINGNVQLVDFVTVSPVPNGPTVFTSYSVMIKRSAPISDGSVWNSSVFAMSSVPGTMKKTGQDTYKFTAIISGFNTINPAKADDAANFVYDSLATVATPPNNITVTCNMDLSI